MQAKFLLTKPKVLLVIAEIINESFPQNVQKVMSYK